MSWIRDEELDLINLDFIRALILGGEHDGEHAVMAVTADEDEEGEPIHFILYRGTQAQCQTVLAQLELKLPLIRLQHQERAQ